MLQKHVIIFFCVLIAYSFCKDERARRVDALFKQYDIPTSAGASVSIIQDGKFLYQNFYGNSELRTPVKITKDTLFCIGSVSKQFTAMGIALLHQRGLLSVDDIIYKHLPQLKPIGNVTILHLIQHTSGYRDYLNLAAISGNGGHF